MTEPSKQQGEQHGGCERCGGKPDLLYNVKKENGAWVPCPEPIHQRGPLGGSGAPFAPASLVDQLRGKLERVEAAFKDHREGALARQHTFLDRADTAEARAETAEREAAELREALEAMEADNRMETAMSHGLAKQRDEAQARAEAAEQTLIEEKQLSSERAEVLREAQRMARKLNAASDWERAVPTFVQWLDKAVTEVVS